MFCGVGHPLFKESKFTFGLILIVRCFCHRFQAPREYQGLKGSLLAVNCESIEVAIPYIFSFDRDVEKCYPSTMSRRP